MRTQQQRSSGARLAPETGRRRAWRGSSGRRGARHKLGHRRGCPACPCRSESRARGPSASCLSPAAGKSASPLKAVRRRSSAAPPIPAQPRRCLVAEALVGVHGAGRRKQSSARCTVSRGDRGLVVVGLSTEFGAELGASDFAADGFRELVDEMDLARVFVGRGSAFDEVLQFLGKLR